MKLEQLAALFTASILFYSPYFFTPTLGGFDTYHYLNVLQIPPSHFLLVKVALFLLLFASVASIALLGEAFHRKGWLAGIFALGSPVLLMEFWKLENDQFAFPILFLSLALFFKGNRFIAFLLLIPAGLVWNGSIVFLIAYGLAWVPLLPLAIFALGYAWAYRLQNFLPNMAVQENWPIIGLLYHLLLVLSMSFVPRKTWFFTAFFAVLAFLNGKFAVLLVPFLAVGTFFMFQSKNIEFKTVPLAALCVSFLFTLILVPSFPPIGEQVEAVQLAVQEAKGGTVFNDWTYGHMVEYYGGKPSAKAGPTPFDYNAGIVLTHEILDTDSCRCINCPSSLAVYRCLMPLKKH